MNQISILHTADLHLGGQLTGLGPAGKRRAIEKFQLFLQLLRWMDEQKTDLFLIAGDFFEGQCDQKVWQGVQEEFRKRPELDIFIAPGNHDYDSIDSPYRQEGWPENVRIFTGEIRRIDLISKKVSVFGSGFRSSFEKVAYDQSADWATLIQGPGKEDPDWINLGLFHGEVKSPGGSSVYNAIHPQNWPRDFFTYVGLGHIHKPSPILFEGKTAYAYSGAPFGSGFDETGRRGFYAGKLSHFEVNLDFIELEPPRFYRLPVDLTGATSLLDIQMRIQQILEEKKEAEKNYYRLYLQGALNPDLQIDLQWLAALFEDQTAYLDLWDQTYPAVDLEKEAEKSTLFGAYVRGILARKEKLGKDASWSGLKKEEAQRDKRDREASLEEDREKRILDQALTLGLKAFYEEGGFS